MALELSIILPVYNVRSYLQECADSIYSQGVAPERYEVIWVDDGSTDGSGEYLDELAEQHANTKVIHQANSGGAARPLNEGLARAGGEYVFFVDSDDYLYPGALSLILEHAAQTGCDLGLFKIKSGWGSKYAGLFDESRYGVTLADTPALMALLGPYKLYKRELLQANNVAFREGISPEDSPVGLEVLFLAKNICVFADMDYYYYRKVENSLSTVAQVGLADRHPALLEGVKEFKRVADKYTSPNELPHVYKRIAERIVENLRSMDSHSDFSRYVQDYRPLMQACCPEQVRATLPFNVFLAADALLSDAEPNAVRDVQFIQQNKLQVFCEGGADAAYEIRNADGTEVLVRSTFPSAEHMAPVLQAPGYKRNRLTALTLSPEGLVASGDLDAYFQCQSDTAEVCFRVYKPRTKECLDFPVQVIEQRNEHAYAQVRHLACAWECVIPYGKFGGLKDGEYLDFYTLIRKGDGTEAESRSGYLSDDGVEESFMGSSGVIGGAELLPYKTGKGNFSIKVHIEPPAEPEPVVSAKPAPVPAAKKSLAGKLLRRLRK